MSSLEREVASLRELAEHASDNAAAARAMASGADRDVAEVRGELRAHTSTLNALRETQLEHSHKVDRHHAENRQAFAEHRQAFAQLAAGMEHITTLLTSHIEDHRRDDA